MKKYIILYVILALSLLIYSLVCAESATKHADTNVSLGSDGDATIFIYHHFGDDRYPTTNVGVDQFQEQMAYLLENDFNVIPLERLVSQIKQGVPIPPKTVVITIDDGYRSIYTKAWPILKRYGFPFTVFLYVEGIENGYKNYLTWNQVVEMHNAGVDFQDHSYSHHRLADRPQGMNDSEYRQWIRADLASGVAVIRERLGERPRYFALPYGEYNRIVMEEVRAMGYDAIFTQDPGSVSDFSDIYFIPREPILGSDWSTLKHFREVLERRDLPLKDMQPNIYPLSETPEVIGARILHPSLYRPDSFGIYVSELGWQPAQLDGDFVYIKNKTPFERRSNRVMISAREKESGRTAARFWLLIKK